MCACHQHSLPKCFPRWQTQSAAVPGLVYCERSHLAHTVSPAFRHGWYRVGGCCLVRPWTHLSTRQPDGIQKVLVKLHEVDLSNSGQCLLLGKLRRLLGESQPVAAHAHGTRCHDDGEMACTSSACTHTHMDELMPSSAPCLRCHCPLGAHAPMRPYGKLDNEIEIQVQLQVAYINVQPIAPCWLTARGAAAVDDEAHAGNNQNRTAEAHNQTDRPTGYRAGQGRTSGELSSRECALMCCKMAWVSSCSVTPTYPCCGGS